MRAHVLGLVLLAVIATAASHADAQGLANDGGIKLIDAGRGAGRPLVYRIAPGYSQTLVIDLASGIELSIGDMKPPMVNTPLLRFTLTLKTRALSSTGSLVLRGNIASVEVLGAPGTPPALIPALGDDLRPLTGAWLTATLSKRGVLSDVRVPVDPGAAPQLVTTAAALAQAIRDLVIPFPDKPIARGARWERHVSITLAGVQVDQMWQYQLSEMSRDSAKVKIDITQTARDQPMTLPGLPPGAAVTIRTLEGTGNGTASVPLTRLGDTTTLTLSGKAAGTALSATEPAAEVHLSTTESVTMRAVPVAPGLPARAPKKRAGR